METMRIVKSEPVMLEFVDELCDICSDTGVIAIVAGTPVYCECDAGACAESASLDRLILLIVQALEVLPKYEVLRRRALSFALKRTEAKSVKLMRSVKKALVGTS